MHICFHFSSDLRHKFEKKKRCKLTVDEKRTFSKSCEQFICTLLDDESDASFVSAVSHQATPLRNYDSSVKGHSNCTGKNENFTPKRDPMAVYCNHNMVSPKGNIFSVQSPSGSNPWEKILDVIPRVSVPPDKTINENKNENLKEFHLTSVNTNTSNRSLYTLSLETTSTRMSENIKGSNLISTPKPTGEESRTVFYRGESIVNDGDEREECLSSVSYDEEKEANNDSDISSDDSSPNILSSEKREHKNNLENVRMAYEKLYNIDNSQKLSEIKKDTPSQNFSYARKRKLDQATSHLLQELSSQITEEDDGKDKIKGGNNQSPVSQGQIADNLTSSASSTVTILARDSLPCPPLPSSEVEQKNASPRTPKGKVYRMLTSNAKSPKRPAEQKGLIGQSFTKQNISRHNSHKPAKVSVMSKAGITVSDVGLVSGNNRMPKSAVQLGRPTAALNGIESTVSSKKADGNSYLATSKKGKGRGGRGRGHPRGLGRGRPAGSRVHTVRFVI